MVKYTWWLQNFSMWHGNFNTAARAIPSKRDSFCNFFDFFFPEEERFWCPLKGFFSSSFHTTFTVSHTLNSTKADEMWTLTELDASCQGSCVTIMLLCNQNLLQERCGCLAASLTGLFQAIQIKKGALFLSRMFLFATSSQLYHFLACETINFSFGQNTQYFTYGDW